MGKTNALKFASDLGINIDVDDYYANPGICIETYVSVVTADGLQMGRDIYKGQTIRYAIIPVNNENVYDVETIGIIYEKTFQQYFIRDKTPDRIKKLEEIGI
jgi:hypothetical protein